jgi:transglutaminase-like putative cysteine protease
MSDGVRAGHARPRGVGLEVALCGLVAGISGLVYAGFYAGWRFAPAVLGVAAVPAVLALASDRWGWSPTRFAMVTAVSLPLHAVLVAYWSETSGGLPGPAAWSALGRGVVNGWAEMLSVGLPADGRGDLLITPVVLTWAASALGALLVMRTASPLLPLAPVTVVFTLGLALVAAGGRAHLAVTAAVLVAALLLVFVRAGRLAAAGVERVREAAGDPPAGADDPPARGAAAVTGDVAEAAASPEGSRRRVSAGQVAFGVPVVVALAVAGPLATGALSLGQGDRFDPRDLRDMRLDIDDALSPLVELKSQLSAPSPDEVFRLDVDGVPDGVDRIRAAALDAYDGAHWTTSAEYRVAGEELPPDPLVVGDPQATVTVRERVTLSGLDGPFLPVIGRPVSVDARGEQVGFDPASGTLVRPSSSPRVATYDVVSEVGALTQVSDEADLPGLRAAATPILDPYRTLPPDIPPQLEDLALLWAGLADSHPEELLALRDQLLQVRYDDSPDAPPGHSYGALLRMLTGEPEEREGYAEQFASAYALLARERGFATRVVVGYLLPEPEADGSYVITEAQAHAWPEVNLVGVGWVVVEPTDLSKIGAAHDPADDVSGAPAETPGPAGDLVDEPVEPRVIVPDATNSAGTGSRLRQGAALGGLLLLVALAALPILSVTVKANRRWRRRTGGRPADRVVGAWQETLDRLTEHGVDVHPAHTSIEVAARTTARFNGSVTSVAPLATLVAVAVYAPTEPSEDAARQAWTLERKARGELDAAGGIGRRLTSRIDPRPLVRRWWHR